MIFPKLEHFHERVAAANIPTLSEHLDNASRNVQKLKDNSGHVLHHLIPKQPATIRHCRRLSSSDKCDKNVLRNPKYLFSQIQFNSVLALLFIIFCFISRILELRPLYHNKRGFLSFYLYMYYSVNISGVEVLKPHFPNSFDQFTVNTLQQVFISHVTLKKISPVVTK